MDPNVKAVLQQEFDALRAKKEAILATTKPLRKKREALIEKMRPLEAQLAALDSEIRAAERPALVNVDQDLATLARALGGKALSDTP